MALVQDSTELRKHVFDSVAGREIRFSHWVADAERHQRPPRCVADKLLQHVAEARFDP